MSIVMDTGSEFKQFYHLLTSTRLLLNQATPSFQTPPPKYESHPDSITNWLEKAQATPLSLLFTESVQQSQSMDCLRQL